MKTFRLAAALLMMTVGTLALLQTIGVIFPEPLQTIVTWCQYAIGVWFVCFIALLTYRYLAKAQPQQ